MRINVPTQLTFLRLLLIPPFLTFLIIDHFITRVAALLVFVIASLTDLYDGRLARRMNVVTTLGTFLDPLADKLLISTALVAFVQIPDFYVPAWMVVLIIGREFLITGLRTLAVSSGRIVPAHKAGKFKTTSQIVTIITILLILCVNSFLEDYSGITRGTLIDHSGVWGFVGWFLTNGPYWLVAITTFFTILSGYIYIRDNRDLFDQNG